MSLLFAIVALCVVIIIHEFGHYLCAVWTGMKVDRFSVFGIGPAILKLGTWRGTEFVIGAIPFGAYVLIRGMEPPDPDDPPRPPPEGEQSHNYRDKPLWARSIVIAGGPVANYLTAMVMLLGVFAFAGVRGPIESISLQSVSSESAAEAAGLQPGDQLVAIGEHTIEPTGGAAAVLSASEPYLGKEVEITVRRDGELVTGTATLPDEPPALGVGLQLEAPRQPVGLGQAVTLAVSRPIEITGQQLQGLYLLMTFQLKANVQGPVGIVKHIARSADAGIIPFVMTAAFISTLLGMFNLLPLPALDGGRLVFLGFEAIARRRANPRIEEMVHGIGMLALLALIALVTIGDIRGS